MSDVEQAYKTSLELIEPVVSEHCEGLGVQPPTPESRALAAKVGIQIGKALFKNDIDFGDGRYALFDVSKEFPADIQTTLCFAAQEAFDASDFKYVRTSNV